MSNTNNVNMTTANNNSQRIVDANKSLIKSCVIVVGDEPTGPSFKASHEGAILFNNKPVKNENVSSGEIRWLGKAFDYNGTKTSVNIQQAIAMRIKRLKREYGFTVNGLCIIPKDSLKAFYHGVETAKVEFFDKRDHLLSQLDALVEEHKRDNPDIADLIDEKKLDIPTLAGRYSFNESIPLGVKLHRSKDKVELQQSAVDAIYDELAKEWEQNYKKSFASKDRVNQKALQYFKGTMDKLLRLAWLDEGIYRIIDSLQAVLGKMPKTGWIEQGDYQELSHWALMLTNRNAIQAHANGDADDEETEEQININDALNDIVGSSEEEAAEVPSITIEIDDDSTEVKLEQHVSAELKPEAIADVKVEASEEAEADKQDTITIDAEEIFQARSDVAVSQSDMDSVVAALTGSILLIEDGSDEDEELTF